MRVATIDNEGISNMFKKHTFGPFCLTLALIVSGLSDASADIIVIDTFDTGVPQFTLPASVKSAPWAIGEERYMERTGDVDVVGGVLSGSHFATALSRVKQSGTVITEWNGEFENSTLGGVDLTSFGQNSLFVIDLRRNFRGVTENKLSLIITDSNQVQSSITLSWDVLCEGLNFIPFASLIGGADLTSVNIIRLEQVIQNTDNSLMLINSIFAAPDIDSLSQSVCRPLGS